MDQAALPDGLVFDAFAVAQDGLGTAEVDIGRGQVAQALVVAPVVVVGDEGLDLGLEVAGQVVVFKQDAVLQRLVPVLDLALGLRMAGRATDMFHGVVGEPFGGVPALAGTVTALRKGRDGFVATLEDAAGTQQFIAARRVLLATGAVDMEPECQSAPGLGLWLTLGAGRA